MNQARVLGFGKEEKTVYVAPYSLFSSLVLTLLWIPTQRLVGTLLVLELVNYILRSEDSFISLSSSS